jgi:hypothetical protein
MFCVLYSLSCVCVCVCVCVRALGSIQRADNNVTSNAIVLHEDKKYYPSASEVYPTAEALVEDEDTQPLTEPVIAPVSLKEHDIKDTIPATTFSKEYVPYSIRRAVVHRLLHVWH